MDSNHIMFSWHENHKNRGTIIIYLTNHEDFYKESSQTLFEQSANIGVPQLAYNTSVPLSSILGHLPHLTLLSGTADDFRISLLRILAMDNVSSRGMRELIILLRSYGSTLCLAKFVMKLKRFTWLFWGNKEYIVCESTRDLFMTV